MARVIVGQDVLPCGCIARTVLQDGERIFEMVPCSLDCERLIYVLKESKDQGKPIEFKEAP